LNVSGVVDLVGTTSNTSFTQPTTFGRRHHSLPYNILCDSPRELYPNDIFFLGTPKWESQNWDSCCPKALHVHIFIKSSLFFEHTRALFYNLQKDLSSGVLHASIRRTFDPCSKGICGWESNSRFVSHPFFWS